MLFKLTSLLEGFAAHLTGEWPLICMCSQVLIQMARLFKSFLTLRTFVGAMLSMVKQMFLQFLLNLVHPFTHSAIVCSNIGN